LLCIFFTNQSTLILDPKIMLNLKLVYDTLIRIFGVVDARSLTFCSLLKTLLTFFWLVIVRIPLAHAHAHPHPRVNDPSISMTHVYYV
jgi:hypothetical protein